MFVARSPEALETLGDACRWTLSDLGVASARRLPPRFRAAKTKLLVASAKSHSINGKGKGGFKVTIAEHGVYFHTIWIPTSYRPPRILPQPFHSGAREAAMP
jgi:hypothetical protein